MVQSIAYHVAGHIDRLAERDRDIRRERDTDGAVRRIVAGDGRREVSARTCVRRAGGRGPKQEVGVVLVRVGAVGAATDAFGTCGGRSPGVRDRAAPLGVRGARVPLVTDGIEDGRSHHEGERVGRTVLDEVGLRRDVEVATGVFAAFAQTTK